MCFDLLPDAVRDPVGFDRRLGQAVGVVVELDVRLSKEETIAPDCLPALAFLGVGRHPHDGVSGDLLGGVVEETIYPGQGLFVRTRCCSARQEGVDAGLAINEENAAGLGTHRSLDERPRFGGGDVLDPIGRQSRRRRDDVASVVDDYESPPVPSQQLGGPIESGAVGVDGALERASRGADDPFEGAVFAWGGTLAAIDGVSPLSIIRSLEVGLLTSVLMVAL